MTVPAKYRVLVVRVGGVVVATTPFGPETLSPVRRRKRGLVVTVPESTRLICWNKWVLAWVIPHTVTKLRLQS